jgi:hypothetical protein
MEEFEKTSFIPQTSPEPFPQAVPKRKQLLEALEFATAPAPPKNKKNRPSRGGSKQPIST